jgi:hypothetical protein
MKVTHSQVKYLTYWRNFTHYYVVKNKEQKTITIQHKIPFVTGVYAPAFPQYLKGFEHCYDSAQERGCYYTYNKWVLKPEYAENRPLYSFTTTVEIMDIELTEAGKEEVQRRYELHKRNMDRYERLLKG